MGFRVKIAAAAPAAGVLALVLAALPAAGAEQEFPATTLRGVLFEGFRVGETEYEVRAARAEVDWNERLARLSEVDIRFREESRGPVHVRAESGVVDLERQNFELVGDVQGTTGRGERFFTEHIRYEQESNSLLGDGPVRIERSGMVFVGKRMTIDLDGREIRFTGSVKATVQPR
jgi:LPS export ABC transporter protein LptC